MSAIPKVLNKAFTAKVGETEYAVYTDGHCAIVRPRPANFQPTNGAVDPSSVVAQALSAEFVPIDRAVLLSFLGKPCRACKDSGEITCGVCGGSGHRSISCKDCGKGTHECACPIGCIDGRTTCSCVHFRRLGRIFAHRYDMRLVRIALGELSAGDLSIGEIRMIERTMPKKPESGGALVIRSNDELGVIMECCGGQDGDPVLKIAGASA